MGKKLPEIRRTERPVAAQGNAGPLREAAAAATPLPSDPGHSAVPAGERGVLPELRRAEAQTIVANYATSASACGLIPVPLIDVVGVSAVQLAMVSALCKHYDVPFSRSWAQALIGSIVGGSLPRALARGLAKSFFKAMPIAGALVGITGVAALANLSTRTLGKLFVDHFEAGGDLETADAANLRAAFEKEISNPKAGVVSEA